MVTHKDVGEPTASYSYRSTSGSQYQKSQQRPCTAPKLLNALNRVYFSRPTGDCAFATCSTVVHDPYACPQSQELNGYTPGEYALDEYGNKITDANGKPTIVNTGLHRPLARGRSGNLIFDRDGRLCYQAELDDDKLAVLPENHDPGDVGNWHIALQIEYAKAHGQTDGDGKPIHVSIGKNERKKVLYVTSDLERVFFIEDLTLPEIISLSKEEQRHFSSIKEFKAKIATLGLTTVSESSFKTQLELYLNSKSTDPNYGMRPDYREMSPEDIKKERNNIHSHYLNDYHVNSYRGQLELILSRLDSSYLISESQLNTEVMEIRDRFKLAKACSLSVVPAEHRKAATHKETIDDLLKDFHKNYRSTGVRSTNPTKLKSSYMTIVQTERRILQLKNEIRSLETRSIREAPGRRVAYYQLLTNLLQDEVVSLVAEKNDQLNDYLSMLLKMQSEIAIAQGSFSDDTDEERRLTGSKHYDQLPEKESTNPARYRKMPLYSFFDTAAPYVKHPIEDYYDIERQRSKVTDGDVNNAFLSYRKTHYDALSQGFSNSSSVVRQLAQVLSNQLGTRKSRSNRHFEASGTIRKSLHNTGLTIIRSIAQ